MKAKFKVRSIQDFGVSKTVTLYPVGCFEGVYREEVEEKLVRSKYIEQDENGKDIIVEREVPHKITNLVRTDTSNTDWCKDTPSGVITLSVDENMDFFVMNGIYNLEITKDG